MKLFTWMTAVVVMLAFNTSIGAAAQSQYEMNQEACGNYKKADVELMILFTASLLRVWIGGKRLTRRFVSSRVTKFFLPPFPSVRYGTLIASYCSWQVYLITNYCLSEG